MELIEGETLAARIGRGPLPVADVLRYGADNRQRAGHGAPAGNRPPGPETGQRDDHPFRGRSCSTSVWPSRSARAAPRLPIVTALQTEDAVTTGRDTSRDGPVHGARAAGRQARRRRTDIFALGCVLHEMATGKRPFSGASQASLISAILSSDPPPISSLQPTTPPALDRLVRRCLAKDPERRVQNARDVALELAEAAAFRAGRPCRSRLPGPGVAWAGSRRVSSSRSSLARFSSRGEAPRPRRPCQTPPHDPAPRGCGGARDAGHFSRTGGCLPSSRRISTATTFSTCVLSIPSIRASSPGPRARRFRSGLRTASRSLSSPSRS